MTNVLFTAGTAWLTLKIGKRLFPRQDTRWLFVVLVTSLPGFLFVGSYVNNDAMALFSTAWICYAWVRYLDEGWSIRNCIWLGAGLAVCFLSYYNAYGWILVSFLFFTFTALFCEEKSWNFQFWLKRGILVAAVAVLLAGWWFVRNAILYDGDILGMKTSSEYAQRYAQEGFKPSERMTPKRQGMSIWNMIWLQPGTWNHNWLLTVLVSFVGTFGYMTVFMPYTLSKLYWLIYLVGGAGILLTLRMFGFRKFHTWNCTTMTGSGPVRWKAVGKTLEWDKERIFHWAMLAAAVIPPILLLQYSWASDFQAQGRYLLPMLLPMMFFVVRGYENLLERLVKNEKIRKLLCLVICILLVGMTVYVRFCVFIRHLQATQIKKYRCSGSLYPEHRYFTANRECQRLSFLSGAYPYNDQNQSQKDQQNKYSNDYVGNHGTGGIVQLLGSVLFFCFICRNRCLGYCLFIADQKSRAHIGVLTKAVGTTDVVTFIF